MDKDRLAKKLTSILPDREGDIHDTIATSREDTIADEASSMIRKKTASELAALKYKEINKLRALEEKVSSGKEIGPRELNMAEEQKAKIAAIEELELLNAKPNVQNMIDEQIQKEEQPMPAHTPTNTPTNTPAYQPSAISRKEALYSLKGTTRPEISKLMATLNVNLDMQLTRQDTANLLAALLTCNSSQLDALYNNKKVPIVIKTVIKRLKEDEKLGRLDTIEKIWDKLFGKGPLRLDLPQQAQVQTGIIPDTPVSREAYILIREALIK